MRLTSIRSSLAATLALVLAACAQNPPAEPPGQIPGAADWSMPPASTIRDTAAPSVVLTSSDVTVRKAQNVLLTAKTEDNGEVERVEFYLNELLISTDREAPYQHTLTLDSPQNGQLVLSARAYDAAGNVASSEALTIDVNVAPPPPADPTPPDVSLQVEPREITAPGPVIISAAAQDNVGVTRVEFYQDEGGLVFTDTTAPFAFTEQFDSWRDNSRYGYFTYTAKAYDAAGNVAASEDVVLRTNIPIPPPTIPLELVSGPWRYTIGTAGAEPLLGRIDWNGMIDAGPPSASFVGTRYTCTDPADLATCQDAGVAFLTVTTDRVSLSLVGADDEVFFEGQDADGREELRGGLAVLAGGGTLGGVPASFELQQLPQAAAQD